MAHIHTEVVAEMVSEIRKRSGRALEVGTGNFHPLNTEQQVSVTV